VTDSPFVCKLSEIESKVVAAKTKTKEKEKEKDNKCDPRSLKHL